MSTATLIAIDPGKSGAMAVFTPEGLTFAACDAEVLASLLRHAPLAIVVIEQVNGIPGQSAPAAFTFGQGFGELIGVCKAFAIKPALVHPAVWKGWAQLRRGAGTSVGAYKKLSLAKATELFPSHAREFLRVTKDDGKAEAALIGKWYQETRA